jgi:hypothetical protein
MKVSHHFSYLRGTQRHQQTKVKRRRVIRSLRALWASFRSRRQVRDDVVLVSFDFELAATEAGSRDRLPFILSEIDDVDVSRGDEMSRWPRDDYPAPERSSTSPVSVPFNLPLRVAGNFDAVLDSFFSPPTRLVSFAELVTVVPIPSHRSLTEEEKNCLYRNKNTGTSKRKSTKERDFEDSEHCFENALEEDMFFPNLKGELVHPVHFRSFVRKVLPGVSRDTIVPGFSSFDEYWGVLGRFARRYGVPLPDKDDQSHGSDVV